MRTKVDKDHKKVTEAKLKMSMTSPKVVLDAEDCAKLLDGMGKTSVVVVERGGKMVAALPSTSTSSTLSSSTSSGTTKSKGVSASQLKSSKSPSNVHQPSSSGASEGKNDNDGTKSPTSLHHNHNKREVNNKSEVTTKAIPKPPKKRRGNDKKFESVESTPACLSNGEATSTSASSFTDQVESAEVKVSAITPSDVCSHSESSQKHSLGNLSPHHPGSTSNNNNHLISGTHLLLPEESSLSQGSEKASLQTTPTSPSVLPTQVSSLSSSPSSSLPSKFRHKDHSQAHESYQNAIHNSASNTPNVVYSKNCFDTPISSEKSSEIAADIVVSEQGHGCEVGLSLGSSSTPAVKSGNFQQLPEQEEPMNLSTSCKSAVSLVSSQTQAGTSPKESNALEEVAASLVPQLSPTQGSTNVSVPSAVSLKPQPTAQSSVHGKKSRKKSPKRSSVIENGDTYVQRKPLSSPSNGNSSIIDKMDVSEKVTEPASGSSEPVSGAVQCQDTSSPNVPSEVLQRINVSSSVQEKVITDSSAEPPASLSTKVDSQSKCELVPSATSSVNPATLCSNGHLSETSSTATSTPATADICSNKDTLKVPSQAPSISTETSANANSDKKVVKIKRPPKKRIEIPMDEVSCADRTAQYLQTINDVIENFVFVPEPPEEECCLTEEEEAAIRDLFEEPPKAKNAAQNRKKTGSASAGHTSSRGASSVGSSHYAKAKAVGGTAASKPPKKRVTAVVAEVGISTKSADSDLDQSNVANVVDSVVADGSQLTSAAKCDNVPTSETQVKVAVKSDTSVKRKKKSKKPVSNTPELSEEHGVHDENEGFSKVEESTSAVCSSEKEAKSKGVSVSKESNLLGKNGESVKDCSKVSSTSSKPKKRKKTAGKPKVSQLAPPESEVQVANHVNVETLVPQDKDSVVSGRVETSDIGESIASTSGGSEQDTPVHEPETKDEMTNTEIEAGESQDTGLESAGEDNKPVRRYKKRLDFVKCSQCDHQARGRSALSRHMKKVHMLEVNMPYKCPHCHYGCTKMASLNRHLFTHGVFPCSRCDFETDERAKLLEHISELHKDKLDMKLCKVCNRYIKCDQITIEEHTDNCQGPTPFKCSQCDKEFKYASSLKVHFHTHFPDEPKRFKCELCEYRTNYKANLHKHHKNMHASRDRDVQCPDCGKMFSTEDNMRRHRKVHTLVRPFACETCKKTFKTSGALKGHQLIHTATRPYSCNIPGCSRSFRTPKFLKSHQEEFHRLVPKKFFCNVEGCNFSFFKRSHLKRHAITHTGERNYHCTWPGCSKSFRHADNLKVHFRSHTNEKPVQCHLCDFKCKQRNSLFWHKKRVHQVIDTSALPRRSDPGSRPGSSEASSDSSNQVPDSVDKARDSPATPSTTKVAAETGLNESGNIPPSVTSGAGEVTPESQAPGQHHVAEDIEQEAMETVTALDPVRESMNSPEFRGPKDLYEFKSDDESEEESPGNFRRDKVALTVLTPLPPPPKELLRKNELQEKKEKEKIEKADKKELEKKERLEKKEQEKKEKAEKKELEKKEKTEQKEKEKKEKAEKKEQAKQEKAELKEKERQEKLELLKKQKEEKAAQKEQERKAKIEMKVKEKEEIKEKARLEKEEKMLEIEKKKKQKLEEKEKRQAKEKVEKVAEHPDPSSGKKSPRRKKSPARGDSDVVEKKSEPIKTVKGKRKRGSDVSVDKSKNAEDNKMAGSPPKKKKISPKKPNTSEPPAGPVSSPRLAARKSPAIVKKVASVSKLKKKTPPKRKPSARIKAKKALAKKSTKSPKTAKKKKSMQKVIVKKRPGRKRGPTKDKEKEEETKEEKEEAEETKENVEKTEEPAVVQKEVELEEEAEEEVVETESQPDPPVEVPSRPEEVASSRPASPEYSEENMIQGVASPYRDFSDADNLEEENMPVETEKEDEGRSPSPCPQPESLEDQADSEEAKAPEEEQMVNNVEEEIVDEATSYAVEESDDDEVSNDIPLTPPRAPAPPPPESSEDEMEQEDPEPAPFSVPGPNTPFSVPGPNTPFSVPPPTNLVQQHSVHSEEAPMSAVPSVPSMENLHSAGSVDAQQPLGSVEMPHHGSVETNHPHGSVEMHSHSSMDMASHGGMESRPQGSVEMQQPLGSVEMQHSHGSIPEPRSQPERVVSAEQTPEGVVRDGSSSLPDTSSYSLPPQPLPEHSQQTTEAAKEYFDEYLKSLTHTRGASMVPSPGGLQQLEAMVDKSGPGSREMTKSPATGLPTSVITSNLDGTLPSLAPADLRSRMDALAASERHHESFYPRDTASALPRLPERQTATPLAPNVGAPPPPPAFDTFSSLNSLHSAATVPGSRESSYLRQPDNLFSGPPVTNSFMAEAMFPRQAMTTPFLTPQPTERSSLSRIPDSTPLRSSTSSSLLRRTTTMPGSEMFPAPPMPQAMPRHPFSNAWTGQDGRPTHWQNPYLQRQPNMATASNPFFPSKENYLGSRDFMFDPSARTSTERGMFPCLPSSQTQDSFQLDRFDLSNYFPNAMTPYSGSPGSLDYTRSAHPTAPKPFDERYRQTAAAAATAAIQDFRALPPTTASTDMFSSIGVNSGFNLYAGTAAYGQHVSDNVNSAFLSHPTTAQHAMLERDYAAAAAHRGFYPHQNTPYPFIEDRQYPGASKLSHAHATSTTGTQERDLMSRSAVPESQMQDPYRTMLYRY
ncbi:uncharacterized protein LOC101861956 [Aplysia californica]|uniref:Uncharacterized protein LOC101861956 n=1 Tax=Aplysia californica TaxID=6500 RepID=A0ABM1A150_APLCA|nr:uncharacterized protein LOC101861956 [Aplysia californica]XP_012938701.1 uncharacterized protein LOC101861956 [Aplysia californica]XP_012938702.1 uncharacterized protein LOC101861956 [Aplysia californica]